MEMICFCGNEEITFPEGIQYEKIQNQSEQSFVTNIKIPQLQSSILSDVLKPFQIDKSQYPEEEYNEIKTNKKQIQYYVRLYELGGLIRKMGYKSIKDAKNIEN